MGKRQKLLNPKTAVEVSAILKEIIKPDFINSPCVASLDDQKLGPQADRFPNYGFVEGPGGRSLQLVPCLVNGLGNRLPCEIGNGSPAVAKDFHLNPPCSAQIFFTLRRALRSMIRKASCDALQ